MVGQLMEGDFEFVDQAADAEVIIVNTCSFIQPATEESIETVVDLARYKAEGCRKLVVTGCMVQRYGEDLVDQFPEVDAFLGTGDYHRIKDVLEARESSARQVFIGPPTALHDEHDPRVNSWTSHSAYLKISEGCDHTCAFCIIPKMRGSHRSRSIPSLVEEARRLVEGGVRELNLVAQDSTAYGRDLEEAGDVGHLLQALALLPELSWIRLHYLYPHGVPERLLDVLANEPKVCRYVDIPLQHASGPMLKAMKRGVSRAGQEKILDRIREAVPDVSLRTTFIVGFPGETDRDFDELVDFVRHQRFDRVGAFLYSQEAGTDAGAFPDQVSEALKTERLERLMAVQAEIALEKHEALVGNVLPVMIDGGSSESEHLLEGRLESQAPEVDGKVFLTNPRGGLHPGSIVSARIVQASEVDLVGDLAISSA
jgi:ribosomal protein S12 methylthiotransferase